MVYPVICLKSREDPREVSLVCRRHFSYNIIGDTIGEGSINSSLDCESPFFVLVVHELGIPFGLHPRGDFITIS